jgi:hypothetical protein
MFFPTMKGLPLHRVMMRTVTEFVDDEMSTYASALAYQMLFSLFPFILFLIALIGFLHLAAPAIRAGPAAPGAGASEPGDRPAPAIQGRLALGGYRDRPVDRVRRCAADDERDERRV